MTLFDWQGQRLVLHASGAAYWKEAQTLFLADLHFGKAMHFRKRGIAVPPALADANWDRLAMVLLEFKPQRVVFLGDLFHSSYNSEWEGFKVLLSGFAQTHFELVRGNHDLPDDAPYRDMGLQVHDKPLAAGPFCLSHEPLPTIPEGLYGLAGHIHPGVVLRGRGRQSLRLPCFYFGPRQGILPAFGLFTGLGIIEPEPGSRVFVLAENQVIAL
jgi:DNA ligase-associated metallophosphoesterase